MIAAPWAARSTSAAPGSNCRAAGTVRAERAHGVGIPGQPDRRSDRIRTVVGQHEEGAGGPDENAARDVRVARGGRLGGPRRVREALVQPPAPIARPVRARLAGQEKLGRVRADHRAPGAPLGEDERRLPGRVHGHDPRARGGREEDAPGRERPVARWQHQLVARGERAPWQDESQHRRHAGRSPIDDPGAQQRRHLRDRHVGRAGDVGASAAGEVIGRARPPAGPDAVERRRGGGQRCRQEHQPGLRPAPVQALARERRAQPGPRREHERVEPRGHQRARRARRRPGLLGGRVQAGGRTLQPEGGGVVRSDELVRNRDGDARSRPVSCQRVERQAADRRRQLREDPAARPERPVRLGDAELRLVGLAGVRGAPEGGRLGVGPAPGEEPDRAASQA